MKAYQKINIRISKRYQLMIKITSRLSLQPASHFLQISLFNQFDTANLNILTCICY